jgi:hypothetical protein
MIGAIVFGIFMWSEISGEPLEQKINTFLEYLRTYSKITQSQSNYYHIDDKLRVHIPLVQGRAPFSHIRIEYRSTTAVTSAPSTAVPSTPSNDAQHTNVLSKSLDCFKKPKINVKFEIKNENDLQELKDFVGKLQSSAGQKKLKWVFNITYNCPDNIRQQTLNFIATVSSNPLSNNNLEGPRILTARGRGRQPADSSVQNQRRSRPPDLAQALRLLQEENQQLRQENEQQRQQIMREQHSHNEIQQENALLRSEIAVAQQFVTAQAQRNADLQSANNYLHQELEEATGLIDSRVEQAKNDTRQQLEADIQASRDENSRLMSANNLLTEENNRLQQQLSTEQAVFQAEKQHLHAEIESLRQQNTRMSATITQKDTDITILSEQLEGNKQEILVIAQDLQESQRVPEHLITSIREQDIETHKLIQENNRLKDELSARQQNVDESVAAISELQQINRAQADQYQTQSEEQQRRLTATAAQNDTQKQAITALEERLHQKDTEILYLQKRLGALAIDYEKLKPTNPQKPKVILDDVPITAVTVGSTKHSNNPTTTISEILGRTQSQKDNQPIVVDDTLFAELKRQWYSENSQLRYYMRHKPEVVQDFLGQLRFNEPQVREIESLLRNEERHYARLLRESSLYAPSVALLPVHADSLKQQVADSSTTELKQHPPSQERWADPTVTYRRALNTVIPATMFGAALMFSNLPSNQRQAAIDYLIQNYGSIALKSGKELLQTLAESAAGNKQLGR